MGLLTIILFLLTMMTNLVFSATTPISHPPTGISDITGWTHFLNSSAPTITTIQDFYALSDLHNGTIRIDRVDGQNMIIEHRSRAQIASLASGSPLDDLAEKTFPGLKVDQKTLKETLAGAAEIIKGFENGNLVYSPLAEKNGGSLGTGGVSRVEALGDKVEGLRGNSSLVAAEKIAGPLEYLCGNCIVLATCWIPYSQTAECKSTVCMGLSCIGI